MQINYWCHINYTGYSIAAQDYILAMKSVKPDLDVRIHPFNKQIEVGISRNRRQIFAAMMKSDPQKECLDIYHSIPDRYRRFRGAKKNIGVSLFETINPPKNWITNMNNMDAIITASQFNKSVFETNGVTRKIHSIPHCFDPKLFNKNVKDGGRYSMFTFVAIGTWKERKNWDSLIRAFYDAFEENDGVCLLIKTDKPVELKSTVERIKKTGQWRSKPTAPIFSETNNYCDFEDIPSILKKGDVYICCSLGEGFGLSGLHAMAMNIPIITTKFGGSLEYAKPEYSTYFCPMGYQAKSEKLDRIPQFRDAIWPIISLSEIRDKLRYAKENYNEIKKKSNEAYNFVHSNFTYEVIGNKFLQVLTDAV